MIIYRYMDVVNLFCKEDNNMAKTKEELQEKDEELNKEQKELTNEELDQVTGGCVDTQKFIRQPL